MEIFGQDLFSVPRADFSLLRLLDRRDLVVFEGHADVDFPLLGVDIRVNGFVVEPVSFDWRIKAWRFSTAGRC